MKKCGFLGGFVFCFFVTAFAEKGGVVLDETKAAFVDYDLQFAFPQKLGGLDYVTVEKYKMKERGYSVFYKKGPSFLMEVSVYKMGHDSIPDGCKGDLFKERFRGVENELDRMLKQKKILNLKKKGQTVISSKSAVTFLTTMFQYKLNTNAATQKIEMKAIAVTGKKNNFVKVTFRFDFEQRSLAKKILVKTLNQLGEMVSKKMDDQSVFFASYEALFCDPASYGGRVAGQYMLQKVKKMGNINIYEHVLVWRKMSSPPKNSELLLAGYFAGIFKAMIEKKSEVETDISAFVSMLDLYKIMRAKNEIEAIAKLDEWSAVSDKKALFEKLLIVEE